MGLSAKRPPPASASQRKGAAIAMSFEEGGRVEKRREKMRKRRRGNDDGGAVDAPAAEEHQRQRKRKRGGGGKTPTLHQPSKQTPPAPKEPVSASAAERASERPTGLGFDPADDCATPLEAYKHVAPLLAKLAQRLKKPKSELRIWDPYFSSTSVAAHLASLGFTNVHNEREDFYALLESGDDARIPPHDVLVTNPPFSGDHVSRLARFLSTRSTPFFVLAPEYVHRKVWYAQLERRRPGIFYMVPLERYSFVAARGGRAQNTNVPCRHWAREGQCPKADACPFLHLPSDGTGVSVGGAGGAKRAGASGSGVGSGADGVGVGGAAPGAVTVAPFDCMWHVHVGDEDRTRSVVAAWRQKHDTGKGGGAGGRGVGAGVRLVASAEGLPPPPARQLSSSLRK